MNHTLSILVQLLLIIALAQGDASHLGAPLVRSASLGDLPAVKSYASQGVDINFKAQG